MNENWSRDPGKYGRRPPKRAAALKLSRYLTGAVPVTPAWADYLATLSGWQMLGNDVLGDCVAVTWANTRRLVTAVLATENYPPMDQVQAVYATQNPGGSDNGMDIQTLLEYLVATGGPDGAKALGFASVDHTSPAEVKAAIDIFGSVWTGINVLDQNMAEFRAGQPWDWSSGAALDGGHSVITGGFGSAAADTGQLAGDEKFITWAQETSFTDAFWANCTEEAWVVIWPEMLQSREFVAGMDMATFAADYTEITHGKPFPAVIPPAPPVPVPVPVPPPAPVPAGPDAADHALWDVAGKWLARYHFGERTLEKALAAWSKAKGLPVP
jgi:hypothetical protein